MSIGSRIKELRKLNKLTQIELSKKANISRSYLADIENDRYNASVDTLKSIANSLNVNLSDILSTDEQIVDRKKERNYSLSIKEQEDIGDEAKKIIEELSLSFSKEKDNLSEEDYFAIENALRTTLDAIKIKNKKKFTPNKYK